MINLIETQKNDNCIYIIAEKSIFLPYVDMNNGTQEFERMEN